LRGEWFQFSILQLSRPQKEFSRRKIDIGAGKLPCETANDCELPVRRDLAHMIEIPFFDFKQVVAKKKFSFGLQQSRPNIIEIDALKGLLDV